jgi:hypothetical protein
MLQRAEPTLLPPDLSGAAAAGPTSLGRYDGWSMFAWLLIFATRNNKRAPMAESKRG